MFPNNCRLSQYQYLFSKLGSIHNLCSQIGYASEKWAIVDSHSILLY